MDFSTRDTDRPLFGYATIDKQTFRGHLTEMDNDQQGEPTALQHC